MLWDFWKARNDGLILVGREVIKLINYGELRNQLIVEWGNKEIDRLCLKDWQCVEGYQRKSF